MLLDEQGPRSPEICFNSTHTPRLHPFPRLAYGPPAQLGSYPEPLEPGHVMLKGPKLGPFGLVHREAVVKNVWGFQHSRT